MAVFGLLPDLKTTIQTWAAGLRRLTFTENFSGELFQGVEIEANTEIAVRHGLGVTPRYVFAVKNRGGVFENGDTADTDTFIYIKNSDSSNAGTFDILVLP